jgi:hypothetical protein
LPWQATKPMLDSVKKKLPKSLVRAALQQHLQELAPAGGKARAAKLSKERRVEIATKASQAAAKARRRNQPEGR